ncbi:hypothetical protein RRF57_002393 [Xylaria bambusicola]|uniref:Uncharacterized protein n=1 Tax=Xylaria bambusicola TaxID=326684 RepID=A0AAN7Z4F5_9PEZI
MHTCSACPRLTGIENAGTMSSKADWKTQTVWQSYLKPKVMMDYLKALFPKRGDYDVKLQIHEIEGGLPEPSTDARRIPSTTAGGLGAIDVGVGNVLGETEESLNGD